MYSDRTVSWIDLPTALIEYIDLVLQNNQWIPKTVLILVSLIMVHKGSYTMFTCMMS